MSVRLRIIVSPGAIVRFKVPVGLRGSRSMYGGGDHLRASVGGGITSVHRQVPRYRGHRKRKDAGLLAASLLRVRSMWLYGVHLAFARSLLARGKDSCIRERHARVAGAVPCSHFRLGPKGLHLVHPTTGHLAIHFRSPTRPLQPFPFPKASVNGSRTALWTPPWRGKMTRSPTSEGRALKCSCAMDQSPGAGRPESVRVNHTHRTC